MATVYLTAQRLRELTEYDPETGDLIWKKCHPKVKYLLGKRVGALDKTSGYISTNIGKKSYRLHRLVWLYHHGLFPDVDVDHINGNRADNRIENLRLAPGGINQQNMKKAARNNKAGLLGVSRVKKTGRFLANIRLDGKLHYLGSYLTPEEAHERYLEAKRELHEGCTI